MSLSYQFRTFTSSLFINAMMAFAGWWGPATPSRHNLLSWLYIKLFNTFIRQEISSDDKRMMLEAGKHSHHPHSRDAILSLPPQQNPEEVGRHRRPMHHKSRSFLKKSHAMEYWRRKLLNRDTKDIARDNILLLTGKPGVPDKDNMWDFELIGNPFDLPIHMIGWHESHFNSTSWNKVALPNHWQLQGFDVPLYTNTSYPFRFDPPFTVRDGVYHLTTCDEGLGSTIDHRLHPKEPGINATGLFRRQFTIPVKWTTVSIFDHRIFLIFEGVDSCLKVWINGNFVGYSQDSCLSAEFDVTEYLDLTNPDNNTIAVEVSRWCDGSYLEDQDKWWLSGIYREVYLLMKPTSFLSDIEFLSSTTFDGVNPVATAVTVSVLAEGIQSRIEQAEAFFSRGLPHAVRVELWESLNDSEPVAVSCREFIGESKFKRRVNADAILDCDTAEIEMSPLNDPGVAHIEMNVIAPKLWSAEDPNLYILVVTLYQTLDEALRGDDDGIHTESFKVGIREIEFGGPDHCLLVNKRKVTIAGVNRLEFEPLTGRAVSKESMLHDAKLLKRLNFNAIRTAHYPQHPYWLEVCDELGLYAIDEANIESHGFQCMAYPIGFLSHDLKWRGAMACRVSRMYERDKNHPCIIGWSLGNESGHGATHDLMADWLRNRDPQRFVQYESGGSCTYATDIICPMYQRPDWCLDQVANDPKRRPVILCEYAHAMGNSGGCLKHYWELFHDEKYSRFQGGFIWDFVDQGLSLSEKEPNKFIYGGDFGESPHSKNFCCNGLTSPNRVPYPDAIEASYLQSPIQLRLVHNEEEIRQFQLEISNRRCFLSLADLEVSITVYWAGSAFLDKQVLGKFQIDVSSIDPQQVSIMDILPQMKQAFNSTNLALHDGILWLDIEAVKRAGTSVWNATSDVCIYHTSFEVGSTMKFLSNNCNIQVSTVPKALNVWNDRDCGRIVIRNIGDTLQVCWSNSQVTVTFNKHGELIGWSSPDGKQLLSSPIELCLFRALTDNDNGGDVMSYTKRWLAAGYHSLERKNETPLKLVNYPNGDVEVVSSLNLMPSSDINSGIVFDCEIRFICKPHIGTVDICSSVLASPGIPELPRVGLRFSIPSTFEQVHWMGLGPHEAYDDRKESAYFGVFESNIRELHTPYVFPQENGRRADPRWILFQSQSGNTRHLSEAIGIVVNETSMNDLASNNKGYGFSASRFSLEELNQKAHDFELKSAGDERIYIHVDSRTMGVGGYDSWSPNVEKKFLISPHSNMPLVTKITLLHIPQFSM